MLKTIFKKIGYIISTINFTSIILLILIYPYAFKNIVGTAKHGFISFTIMLACLSFVFAIGFKPEKLFWKIIINPIFTTLSLIILLFLMFLY